MSAIPSNAAALAQQCADAITAYTELKLDVGQARITVVTPKGWKAPPRFPRGEMLQWKEDGSRVRSLPAMNVLAWLAAHGFVKIKAQVRNDGLV